MAQVAGVKFRTPGKVYYFSPGEFSVKYGDHVIVETARGVEYGTIVLPVHEVEDDEIRQPLKEVMRIATREDDDREKNNREKEEEACRICREKIRERGLDMKLVSAEYTFDNTKLTFYFTADGRIDFRELVKDLAGAFRTRIELRQIGVRDETRILGGIGICGRPLCCHTYLHEFAPVSIRMAKEQNLSLNPTKISGSCGRLMCCLKNEAETYEYLNRGMPRKGDGATTPDGYPAEIQSVNILRQTVRVIVDLENDEKEMREYPVSEIQFVPKKSRKRPAPEEDLKEEAPVSAQEREAAEGGAADPEEDAKKAKNPRKKHRTRRKNTGKTAEETPGKAQGGSAAAGAPEKTEPLQEGVQKTERKRRRRRRNPGSKKNAEEQ